jgi:hypothetical protein
MNTTQSAPQQNQQQDQMEERKRLQEEELRKLVVQRVKLPNGATFTRLKPVTVA